MKHFTWKVFFVFSNAFLINWISPNCAGSSQVHRAEEDWDCWTSLSVPSYFLPTYSSNIPIPIYRKYCKHFHGIFPTSQTCYNFNRETSRISFIKIPEHIRLFLEEEEDSSSMFCCLGFYEPAKKMLDSSENLHSSSCVFSRLNLVMFCSSSHSLVSIIKQYILLQILDFGKFEVEASSMKHLRVLIKKNTPDFPAETFMKLYISSVLILGSPLWVIPLIQDWSSGPILGGKNSQVKLMLKVFSLLAGSWSSAAPGSGISVVYTLHCHSQSVSVLVAKYPGWGSNCLSFHEFC